MSQRGSPEATPSHTLALFPSYPLLRRVRDQALLWLLFGAVVGAWSGAPPRNTVGVVSGMMAGIIVMPWLGVVVGLIGARVETTLFGGVSGLLIGALTGALVGAADPAAQANLGLIGGALVGATFPVLSRLTLGKVWSKLQSCYE